MEEQQKDLKELFVLYTYKSAIKTIADYMFRHKLSLNEVIIEVKEKKSRLPSRARQLLLEENFDILDSIFSKFSGTNKFTKKYKNF